MFEMGKGGTNHNINNPLQQDHQIRRDTSTMAKEHHHLHNKKEN
jgi:hypothetical protein